MWRGASADVVGPYILGPGETMKNMLRARALLALVFFAAGRLLAGQGDLGRTQFANSGAAAAQQSFLRGLLLLHSFEYEDSAEAFREAEKIDPGFAMAYWGEAMTYNHPLWMQQDRDAARKALDRLAPTPAARLAKAPTAREKAYLEAVEILYGEGDKASRDLAYSGAMRRLHEAYPDDLDAAAFYALSILGTTEGKRDFATYMRAAAVAEDVFAKNPQHPGAVHYLIHCYDDPIHAPLGMRPARVYAKIAPAATHALHMPSHIFFAMGMWEDAVSSNEASWQASLDRAKRKGLGAGSHSHHALSWLEYADLQLGRFADARRALATMQEDQKESPNEDTTDYLGAMRAAWIVETGRCTEDVLAMGSALGTPGAREFFVQGSCALAGNDLAGAEKALAGLRNPAGAAAAGHYHGSAGRESRSREVAAVLGKELEAKIALSRVDGEKALRLALEAAALEDAMTFDFGPPDVVKPSHELAGEIYLTLGRPAEAQKEFEKALAHAPGRAQSLLGLARAAAKAGDAAASAEAYGKLQVNWSRADHPPPAL
jgi:tetratricopeptide (TPR) repeat protein